MKDFTMMNQTECIDALNKEITNLKEELEYYKESERALKDALRNMVAKVKTNSWWLSQTCGIIPASLIETFTNGCRNK